MKIKGADNQGKG